MNDGDHENNNEKVVHINNNKSEVGESEINGNVSLDSTDSSNLSTSTGTLSLTHLSVAEFKTKFLKQKKRPDAKSAIEKYEIIQKM